VSADELVDRLFGSWAAGYARGESPDPLPYLEQAGSSADDLAALMDGFLQLVPRDAPSEETLVLARAWVSGESPLVALRVSRGVRRDDVVDAVMREFELAPAGRPKVRRYYHELEAGLLDPTGVDRRVLDLVAHMLRATRDAILAWRPRSLAASPAFRASGGGAPAPSPPAPAAAAHEDEVDRLFRSAAAR
jgi:hypothetical protein